ncbi:hypothetical protein [Streptomyces parvulus]|uniref:hypothetical protein n=1 Tax=Streptomyces parvulus TaxID=146923 RepID=UPI0036ACA073
MIHTDIHTVENPTGGPTDLQVAIHVAQRLLDSDNVLSLQEALRLLLRALGAEPDDTPPADEPPAVNSPAPEPDPERLLFAAVLDAIDIPHAVTVGGNEAHDRLLNDRVMHARIALQNVLGDGPDLGPAWNARYLRERLAEHPVTGYVTTAQAHAALAEGKTWSEAVSLPAGEGQ